MSTSTPGQIVYRRTAERPDPQFWLEDTDGTLLDLSTGYTFEFKLGYTGQDAVFTKTTGITGAVGAGLAPPGAGTPNLTVTFTAGELDAVPATQYEWQLRVTSGGLDRFYGGQFVLLDVIG